MWEEILNYLRKHRKMQLISPSSRGQTFDIEETTEEHIRIRFFSGTPLKIEKKRFESSYNYLKEKKGEWIKIGASRVGTNPKTLEGRIKREYNGNMNGLSTAPWVATILVRVFDNIDFNGKSRGQAIRMR